MTQGGFAGNERYLAMPVALGCVLSGAGWASLGKRLNRLAPRDARRWTGPLIAVAWWPSQSRAIPRLSLLDKDDTTLRFQGQLRDDLHRGGCPVRRPRARARCGGIYAGAYNVAMVSWMLDVPGEAVATSRPYRCHLPRPVAERGQSDAAGERGLEACNPRRRIHRLRGLQTVRSITLTP